MKHLMTSAATVLILSGSAWGAAHTEGAFTQYEADEAVELFVSDLLGARIYATEAELGETMEPGAEAEWDDLGEINDIIMNEDGSVEVVVLGIGGFLGIGERDVAVQFSELNILRDGEDPTDYFLVVNAAQADIEGADEFSRAGAGVEMGEGAVTGDEAVEAEADATMDEAGDAGQDAAAETNQAAQDAAAEVEDAAEGAEAEIDGAAAEAEAEMDGATESQAEGAEADAEANSQ